MLDLNENYWENRYLSQETGWDLGRASEPIVAYFEQFGNKKARILIPGAGNAHEATYLFSNGFPNVHVLDIATPPLEALQQRVPTWPSAQLHHADFFDFEPSAGFDIIVEQTFFCALPPSLRSSYAKKMASLLTKGGKLIGLLFDDTLNDDRPPFGGHKEEYLAYFEPYFRIKYMDPCYNSVKPRAGRELFICLETI